MLSWVESKEAVHWKLHQKADKLGEVNGKLWGPPVNTSQKTYHNRSALAGACIPSRRAEQEGVESESRLQQDCYVAIVTVFALNR